MSELCNNILSNGIIFIDESQTKPEKDFWLFPDFFCPLSSRLAGLQCTPHFCIWMPTFVHIFVVVAYFTNVSTTHVLPFRRPPRSTSVLVDKSIWTKKNSEFWYSGDIRDSYENHAVNFGDDPVFDFDDDPAFDFDDQHDGDDLGHSYGVLPLQIWSKLPSPLVPGCHVHDHEDGCVDAIHHHDGCGVLLLKGALSYISGKITIKKPTKKQDMSCKYFGATNVALLAISHEKAESKSTWTPSKQWWCRVQ